LPRDLSSALLLQSHFNSLLEVGYYTTIQVGIWGSSIMDR